MSCEAIQLMQVLTELPVMYFVFRNLAYSHRLAVIDVLCVLLGVRSEIQGTSHLNPVLSAASIKTVVFPQLLKRNAALWTEDICFRQLC